MSEEQLALFDVMAEKDVDESDIADRGGEITDNKSNVSGTAGDVDSHQSQVVGRVRFAGATTVMNGLIDYLALCENIAAAEKVRPRIMQLTEHIERMIVDQRIPTSKLTSASRAARSWFAYFSDRMHLQQYMTALLTARTAFEAVLNRHRRWPRPYHVSFRPIKGLYRMQAETSSTKITLPVEMICFDRCHFESLACHAAGIKSDRHLVHRKMMGRAYQSIRTELESLGGQVIRSTGSYHDLIESFDRVNRKYFNGSLTRPRLAWSGRLSRRVFGHYDLIHDTVSVGSALDDPGVPQYVVDFIMYHELLHKKHGAAWSNDRMNVHTSEFKRDERKFEQYKAAESFIRQLSRSRRRRRAVVR